MVYQHIGELYELYLLGALDREESAPIQEHVKQGCPRCLEELREAALSVYLLCQAVRPVRPGPQHKTQFLRRLRKK